MNAFINAEASTGGVAAVGVVSICELRGSTLSARFAADYLSPASPRYLRETFSLRSDPGKLFPWARSIFILAIPFTALPSVSGSIEAKDSSGAPSFPLLFPDGGKVCRKSQRENNSRNTRFVGRIAAYAARIDYHVFAKSILAELAEDLKSALGRDFRAVPAVDTQPLPERSLAVLAGLGTIGRNQALLVPGYGSGCFLCELVTDVIVETGGAQIPNDDGEAVRGMEKGGETDWCQGCGACVSNCPTGALSCDSRGGFAMERCRSHLTIERREPLSDSESELLGDWIFGCGECLNVCRDTRLPPPAGIDLRWLLEVSAGEVSRSIKGTAMEYAGVTQLRRNALIVLGNDSSKDALELVARFSRRTSSELLRETAARVLYRRP
ncbi:MAG: epoxyqueuosine reductase [Kiritimatiellaeota bacterium]|nr:epoxyqueuosine reductase [Kiritimatiellota bacterium]